MESVEPQILPCLGYGQGTYQQRFSTWIAINKIVYKLVDSIVDKTANRPNDPT